MGGTFWYLSVDPFSEWLWWRSVISRCVTDAFTGMWNLRTENSFLFDFILWRTVYSIKHSGAVFILDTSSSAITPKFQIINSQHSSIFFCCENKICDLVSNFDQNETLFSSKWPQIGHFPFNAKRSKLIRIISVG